jgi:hypothetical protein
MRHYQKRNILLTVKQFDFSRLFRLRIKYPLLQLFPLNLLHKPTNVFVNLNSTDLQNARDLSRKPDLIGSGRETSKNTKYQQNLLNVHYPKEERRSPSISRLPKLAPSEHKSSNRVLRQETLSFPHSILKW